MKLTKKLTVEQKNQLKNMVFVGRLASPDELSLTFIESPITISEYGNKITFYIKCLSEIPGEIEEHFEYQNKIFTGNTNSYYNIRLLEQYDIFMEREHYVDLKPKVKNLLENRLIIFQLDPKDEFIYVDMKDIEPIQPEQQYYLLPGPKLKLSEDNKDLADKLVGNRRPIGLDYYPDILTPAPELIIYDDYLYRVDLECKSNPTTYFQKELSEVKYIQLSPEEKSQYLDVMYDDYLYFVSAKNYDYLWQKVENEGAVLNDEIETEVVIGNEEMREKTEKAPSGLKVLPDDAYQSELRFLEKLKYTIQKDFRIFHTDETLLNFHLSVKTNSITILGGMSGTGKTQLAKAYAKALELPKENCLFIPITPSYQEPADILGYLNPQTGLYHESDTGLVSLLLEAEAHPEQLYMVIFDEMNLSQVEHWFSPFLSLLEVNDERELSLFNEGIQVFNGKYKPKIKLNDNLIFIGTANFDETTKSFSDRLLDRINIIVPQKANFSDAIDFYRHPIQADDGRYEKLPVTTEMMRQTWMYQKDIGLHLFTDDEIYILDEIHRIIHEQDPQKGVSFRTALSIAEYMFNIPMYGEKPLISRKKAFDLQINQRILTKIKGIDTFLEKLVGYYDENNEYHNGLLTDLFQSAAGKRTSDFNESIQTLKNKAKEMNIYGFAN